MFCHKVAHCSGQSRHEKIFRLDQSHNSCLVLESGLVFVQADRYVCRRVISLDATHIVLNYVFSVFLFEPHYIKFG